MMRTSYLILHAVKWWWSSESLYTLLLRQTKSVSGLGRGGSWDSRFSQQSWWTKLPGMTSVFHIPYSVSSKEHSSMIVYNDFVVAVCQWIGLLAKQILQYSLHGLSWWWTKLEPWLVDMWDLCHWLFVGYWHFRETYQFHLQGSSSPRRLVVSYWCFRIAH
jgi:hypothetical protein